MRWQIDESAMDGLCSRSRDDDPFHLFSQGPDDAAMQVSESLEGRSSLHRQALAERMGARRAPFDRRSAEMIAHVGIDPLSLSVMGRILDEGFCVRPAGTEEDDPATVWIPQHGRSADGFVRLSPDVVWQFDGRVTVDGLPETIAIALKGRPLSDAVSHPLLDPKGHVIASVRREAFGDRTYTHLEISPPVALPNGADLLGIDMGADA